MNNKGFAITTMLYGTFLVFLMLMFVMLGLLNNFKNSMDMLVEGNGGARDIVGIKCSDIFEPKDTDGDGIYEYSENLINKDYTLNENRRLVAKLAAWCGYTIQ